MSDIQKSATPLPEVNFQPDVADEIPPPGPARGEVSPEVISKEEERYHKSNEFVPTSIIDIAAVTKVTGVTPVDVNAKVFWGFLESFLGVASSDDRYPILTGVKMTFIPGPGSKLLLESTNMSTWCGVSMDASGGSDGFEAVLPLRRTISIMKVLALKYERVQIGMDDERIHIGDFSFPFHGYASHFPKKPRLEDEVVSVVLSMSHLVDIRERVRSAVNAGKAKSKATGCVYIDFDESVAVATNGARMHILHLPMMRVDVNEAWKDVPSGINVPPEAYEFIHHVEMRDVTGFKVGETKVMIGHEDFGMIAQHSATSYPDWKKAVPKSPGVWTVTKEDFLGAVREAAAVAVGDDDSRITISFDVAGGMIIVASNTASSGSFERSMDAESEGKLVQFLHVGMNFHYVIEAIEACRGSAVRIGVERAMSPVTFRGEDNMFMAVVMPMREGAST